MTVRDILLEMDRILHLMMQTQDGDVQLEMLDSVIEKAESIEDDLQDGAEMLANMRSERDKLRRGRNQKRN